MLVVLSILGSIGLYIVNNSLLTTAADEKLNLAEKAANAGLLRAVDQINSLGFCSNQSFQGNLVRATNDVTVKRSGRICFVKSEGTSSNAKIVKTGIVQSFYGLGLYTVRGNVNANINGSDVRLSGCDRTVTPTCYVPAFIASGTITTTLSQRTCAQDASGSGLYGNPALFPGVVFDDLIPLFFNVDCFNQTADPSCGQGLLQVFENIYGSDNGNQDLNFDNTWGIPRISIPNLPAVPNIPACTYSTNNGTLNLSTQLTTCNEIIITGINVTVTGNGTRAGNKGRIYAQAVNSALTINNASNFILYTTRQTTVNSTNNTANDCSDFELYNTNTTTVNTSSNFKLHNTGATTFGGTIQDFRSVTRNTVTASANASLTNGTVIIGPANINDTDNVNTPLNFITQGTITVTNVNLFARSLRFANNSTVNIWDSLVYVYAYACPTCSRATSTSSLDACGTTNNLWCGWYGNGIALNIGRDANNAERPTIFMTNNSTVLTASPSATAYIWGAFVGQDVTYLRWTGGVTQRFRGFLIRNFPTNLSLNINISGDFDLEFRKSLIDTLATRYWFFRKVDCIRDDMSPLTQTIQTGMMAY